MAYKTSRIYTRTSVESPWHIEAGMIDMLGWIEIEAKYPKTRNAHLLDPLNLELEVIWPSKENYDQYFSEPLIIAHQQLIAEHCEKFGITIHSRVEHGDV